MGRPRLDDEEDEAPSPRRILAMRARYFGGARMAACGCGRCGLYYPIAPGRRFHPDCPSRSDEPEALRSRAHLAIAARPRRCELCEDMPHRRWQPACPVCDRAFAPELISPPPVSIGCGIGGL